MSKPRWNGVAILCAVRLLAVQFTGADCYPEYQECGEDLADWLALNFPDIYDNPGQHGNVVYCDALIKDALGRPAAGVQVNLYLKGTDETDGTIGHTDANGRVTLWMNKPADFGLHYTYCRVFPQQDPVFTFDYAGSASDPTRLRSVTSLQVGHTAPGHPDLDYAVPDANRWFYGNDPGAGYAQLYLAGEYDRGVVVTAGFDPSERSIDSLFDEIQPVLLKFQSLGIDTWVFKPHRTTQNLHEQAAELAQMIEYAATYDGGTSDGKVAVVGFSAGGLAARIATARWEDPNEQNWRIDVGVEFPFGTDVPVSLLAQVDVPNRGAHINTGLQALALENGLGSVTALDSCGAAQMLREICIRYRDYDQSGGEAWFVQCTNGLSRRFYDVGGEDLQFDFDWTDGAGPSLICEGGPAVNTLNGDGYPHGPRVIASSNGQIGTTNRCYGTRSAPSSLDLNFLGQNICEFAENTAPKQSGDEYVRINVEPSVPDPHVFFQPWDLTPGSRFDALLEFDARWGPFTMTSEQQGSPTFVPLTSALDVRACDPFTVYDPLLVSDCMPLAYDEAAGGLQERHPAIADSRTNGTHMGTHILQPPATIAWIVDELDAALGRVVDPPIEERPGIDGSCELRCGDSEPSGDCYCDGYCEDNNDCCDDYVVFDPQPGEFAGCRPAPVCGDETCETFGGLESNRNCCWDCLPCDPGPVCGDGTCEDDETSANCPADCGSSGGGNCGKLCVQDQP